MFHFESPINFLFLILIISVIGVFMANQIAARHSRQKLASAALFAKLAPAFNLHRARIKFSLLCTAAFFIIIALANPRYGLRTQAIQRQSVDLFLAFDISKSMLAQDVSPSRLEKARQFGLKLVNSLRGERIGLISFAGEATMELPLTVDYQAAEMLLQNISVQDATVQGTALEQALEQVMRAQARSKQKKQKAVLIITDGENHEQDAIAKAQNAAEQGIFTFIVGVGTTEGAKIPISSDTYGGFQLDKSGAVVISKMNKTLMEQVAAAGQGLFWDINESNSNVIISDLATALGQIEKSDFEQRAYDDYESYFYIGAAIALLLLLVEMLIPYAQKPKTAPKSAQTAQPERTISRKAELLG